MESKHQGLVMSSNRKRLIASSVKAFIVSLAAWQIIPGKLAEFLIRWLGVHHD